MHCHFLSLSLLFIHGLDVVLSEARKHVIKMILSLVNYYHVYGGRKQYVDWAKNQGQNIPSDDGFFTNPVIKGSYKNHIKVRKRDRESERESAVNHSEFVSLKPIVVCTVS